MTRFLCLLVLLGLSSCLSQVSGLRCNPKANGWSCCNPTNPCGIGEGDCDKNADCAGDLICGTDNCPTGDGRMDCCKRRETTINTPAPTTTTQAQTTTTQAPTTTTAPLSRAVSDGENKGCENPKGTVGEKITEGGIEYICTEKNGWVPYGCPKIVEVDHDVYRFFDKRPTPCVGNINQCVYALGFQLFCKNGDYPNVTPYILPVEPYKEDQEEFVDPVATFVTTTLGKSPGPRSFNMSTVRDPVLKYTFFQSIYRHRKVCSGFKWEDVNRNEHTEGNVVKDLAGDPIEIDLGSDGSDFITGISGRYGTLIDQLDFTLQSGMTVHPCGGPFGTGQDVTPPAHIYGFCILVNIAGTYKPDHKNDLATLQFIWQCTRY